MMEPNGLQSWKKVSGRILIQTEWHNGTYGLQSWKKVSGENFNTKRMARWNLMVCSHGRG
jgi:hypothetical protein